MTVYIYYTNFLLLLLIDDGEDVYKLSLLPTLNLFLSAHAHKHINKYHPSHFHCVLSFLFSSVYDVKLTHCLTHIKNRMCEVYAGKGV